MNESVIQELNLKKYRQAGIGFFILNLIYFGLAVAFLPPMGLGGSIYIGLAVCILFLGWMSWLIAGGRRKLTLICAVIFALRFFVSVRQMMVGEAFLVVPYLLPCLILTFYMLGRAVWDWP
ncbi:MAG: hypothetical protein COV66_14570 [Nitrospinae bacterium CG11_big_fil_rev_8_21_14_0_20_45_15]|nr:MAG: hypothetical protein COV66_14570 [Nitrospinae bacterium CG11_big_fil_rev_8_21_14_0_20_45_15]